MTESDKFYKLAWANMARDPSRWMKTICNLIRKAIIIDAGDFGPALTILQERTRND